MAGLPSPPCRSVDARPRPHSRPPPGRSPAWRWAGPRCPSWCPTTRSTRCSSSTPGCPKRRSRSCSRCGRSPRSSPRCRPARWPTAGPDGAPSSSPAVLQAAAFVVWTAAPGFPAFAVGFVVWGVGGALMSGTSEALVYDALAAVGARAAYVRVHGWMTSAELLVQVPTALLASGLFALGGYPLVGWVERRLLRGRGAPRAALPGSAPGGGRRGRRHPPLRGGHGAAPSGPAAGRAGRGAHRRPGRGRGVLPGPRRRPRGARHGGPGGDPGHRPGRGGGGRARWPCGPAARPCPARPARGGRDACSAARPCSRRARRSPPRRCSTRSTWRCWWWPRLGCRTGSPARTARP